MHSFYHTDSSAYYQIQYFSVSHSLQLQPFLSQVPCIGQNNEHRAAPKMGKESGVHISSHLKEDWISSRVLPLVSGTKSVTNAIVRAIIVA